MAARNRTVLRVLKPPSGSFFLFGPRGSGKSTWARAALPDALRFDLLDESLYQSLLADPSIFADRLRTVKPGSWVWVDEIQRLPNLLNEVHRFIEERKLKFALTGSSARKLRRSGVNLLGGRAVTRTMFPFLPEELGSDFDLATALRFGTLCPGEAAPEALLGGPGVGPRRKTTPWRYRARGERGAPRGLGRGHPARVV